MKLSGKSILKAAHSLSTRLPNGYSPETHSVYLINGSTRVKKKANSKSLPSRVHTGQLPAIVTSDVFRFPFDVIQIDLIVLANDTPNSLRNNCVGGNFFGVPSDSEDFSSSLVETAIKVLITETQKTLICMAQNTFQGRPPRFISHVLLGATSPHSSHQPSPSDILDDSTFGFVKLFITSLAKECEWKEFKDLKNTKEMIEAGMNSATVEAWLTFRSSLSHSYLPPPPQSLPAPAVLNDQGPIPVASPLWAFLGIIECPVFQIVENSRRCVELKTFTTYSIRDVILELQQQYSTFEIGSRFRVIRCSSDAGTIELGKYLNGKFEGEPDAAVVKISHTMFVIQDDEESPPVL